MSVRRLIVNADDMGLTEGHNRAIARTHTQGVLTSASLLACGAAFDDAIRRARALPGLGIGVHLTLLEGTAVQQAAAIPDLVDRDGLFGQSYGRLLWGITLGQIALDQVRDEWRAQIEKVMITGLRVTHLDSHKHIHMHPQLLGATLELADEFGVRRMRLSRSPGLPRSVKGTALGLLAVWARWRLVRRGIGSPDALLGLEASGRMNTARVLAAIRRPWRGVRELMMHPAYPGQDLALLLDRGYRWIAGYRFRDELAALCSPQVSAALDERQIQLVDYEAV